MSTYHLTASLLFHKSIRL